MQADEERKSPGRARSSASSGSGGRASRSSHSSQRSGSVNRDFRRPVKPSRPEENYAEMNQRYKSAVVAIRINQPASTRDPVEEVDVRVESERL